jgi:hypothetical protein
MNTPEILPPSLPPFHKGAGDRIQGFVHARQVFYTEQYRQPTCGVLESFLSLKAEIVAGALTFFF